MALTYVLSPYTHMEWDVMTARYNAVQRHIFERMEKQSINVYYSPIVYFHPLADVYDLPKDADYWEQINTIMLRRSTSAEVLMIPGYEESYGINKLELPLINQLQIPVVHVNPSEKVLELATSLR